MILLQTARRLSALGVLAVCLLVAASCSGGDGAETATEESIEAPANDREVVSTEADQGEPDELAMASDATATDDTTTGDTAALLMSDDPAVGAAQLRQLRLDRANGVTPGSTTQQSTAGQSPDQTSATQGLTAPGTSDQTSSAQGNSAQGNNIAPAVDADRDPTSRAETAVEQLDPNDATSGNTSAQPTATPAAQASTATEPTATPVPTSTPQPTPAPAATPEPTALPDSQDGTGPGPGPGPSDTTAGTGSASNLDFSNQSLIDTIYLDDDLDGANFSGADLTLSVFAEMSMTGADFTGAILQNAFFDQVDLTGANFTDADLSEVITFETQLARAIWSNTICPDGTNSDDAGGTCVGHLLE